MTITVVCGNLFQIAAVQMGDAMQWINIARVNGIEDPVITTLTQIVIPTASSVFSDGIGPQ
jgi:hypothetical protein